VNVERRAKAVCTSAATYRQVTADTLSRMVRIPSMSGREREVIEEIDSIAGEFGISNRRIDGLGNLLLQVGSGPRLLAIDAHIDTVDVGDSAQWDLDPFSGLVRDEYVHGRGTVDQEGGAASMLTAARVLAEADYGGPFTLLFTFTVMEEDCDGLCWNYLIEKEGVEPELAVITEPTNLNLYRGHRGRMEIDLVFKGISAHGSAPSRGASAISMAAKAALNVVELNESFVADDFLGPGSAVVSRFRSGSPSLCAVPDQADLHIDRRLTTGETRESACAEIEVIAQQACREVLGTKAGREIPQQLRPSVSLPRYETPGYRGLSHPQDAYFPTWSIPADHPLVIAGSRTAELVTGKRPEIGKWVFSTNGVALCGKHGIPTIGFGPGNEIHAHATNEKTPIDHLQTASAFYAMLPYVLEEQT
jgi:putative selenium metabolism hydrolase